VQLKQGLWAPIAWLIVPMICVVVVMLLASRPGTAEQGLTCEEMGWYPAARGAECAADCAPSECKRKQWCRTGPCEPFPHYCWACPEGPPPTPTPPPTPIPPSPSPSPTVTPPPPSCPEPKFYASNYHPRVGEIVTFTVDTATVRMPVNLDFGDSNFCIDCGATMTHAYGQHRRYVVRLSAVVPGCEQRKQAELLLFVGCTRRPDVYGDEGEGGTGGGGGGGGGGCRAPEGSEAVDEERK